MRYYILCLAILAGCSDGTEEWKRSLEQRGIPYHVGENHADRQGRFIMLRGKGYKMTDAELAEYVELDAKLHPTAAKAAAVRSGKQP